MKRKAPKKSELYEQIERLEKQNRKLSEELERNQQMEWKARLPEATEVIRDFLRSRFGYAVRKLSFEHVDAAGFWFTFELAQDSRRQTWCVRHSDLEG